MFDGSMQIREFELLRLWTDMQCSWSTENEPGTQPVLCTSEMPEIQSLDRVLHEIILIKCIEDDSIYLTIQKHCFNYYFPSFAFYISAFMTIILYIQV